MMGTMGSQSLSPADDDHGPSRFKVGVAGLSHRDGRWRVTHAHASRSRKSEDYIISWAGLRFMLRPLR